LKGATVLVAALLLVVIAGDVTSQFVLPSPHLAERSAEVLVTEAVEREVVESAVEEFAPTHSPTQLSEEMARVVEASPIVEDAAEEEVLAKEMMLREAEATPEPAASEAVEKLAEKEDEVGEKPAAEAVDRAKEMALAPAPTLSSTPGTTPPAAGAAQRDVDAPAGTPAEELDRMAEAATVTVAAGAVATPEAMAPSTTAAPAEVMAKPEPMALPEAKVEPAESVATSRFLEARVWRWLEAGAIVVLLVLGGFLWLAKRQRNMLHL
jgi:hypothetical protein